MDKINKYVDDVLSKYSFDYEVKEFSDELKCNLNEKYDECLKEGMNELEAYEYVINSIGNLDEVIDELEVKIYDDIRSNLKFNAGNFNDIDLTTVNIEGSTFNASALQNGNFDGSILKENSFNANDFKNTSFKNCQYISNVARASDLNGVVFDDANLYDSEFVACDLANTSFTNCVIEECRLMASDFNFAQFSDTKLMNTKFKACDLSNTKFVNNSFDFILFHKVDLSNVSFDNQVLRNIEFKACGVKNMSFKGSVLKEISFKGGFNLTGKFYKSLGTIDFSDAKMDKITYAQLSSYCDLKDVEIIKHN